MKWYKRDPSAALAGMIGLTPEERGVYNTVIDLLYARDGDLPDDETFMSKACDCRPQMWRRIRDQLIAKGKLRRNSDETGTKLMANRVETELKLAQNIIEKMTNLGVLSAEKNKNKDLASTGRTNAAGDTTTTTTTTTPKKKEKEDPARPEIATAPQSTQAQTNGAGAPPPEGAATEYVFDEGVIRITGKDMAKLEQAYPEISVGSELYDLASWPKLTKQNWWHIMHKALRKRNDAHKMQRLSAQSESSDEGGEECPVW